MISATYYHQRTKHHLNAYARGPEGLDWDNQPNPFRRFAACTQLSLPLKSDELNVTYADLFLPNSLNHIPLNLENIAILCELAMGLSAWKIYGSTKWSLRCNPSSGNLHPTEAYLMLPDLGGVAAGVYHYASREHSLEKRCMPKHTFSTLLPPNSFLLGLSSIHWREAWKYGERAFRYCQLDVGHLIASLRYAAACLGWRVTLQENWDDDSIATVLGLNRKVDFRNAETESPDAILLIETDHYQTRTKIDKYALIDACVVGQWQGRANTLSEDHEFEWTILDDITRACTKHPSAAGHQLGNKIETPNNEIANVMPDIILPEYLKKSRASIIIRQRRSAQAFDGETSLPFSVFCRMLDALLPRNHIPPFDAITSNTQIHLIIFVHRVEGLNPGLYCLPRSQNGEALLREECNKQFEWARSDNLPDDLPLYTLVHARCGQAANTLSCHQPIASDSAFSLAMLAEFEIPLKAGDWVYRQLFWEAGIIGQSLYLEAEAAGVRGTGIGCFFDDKVHETLGISSSRLQDLYHFTVGTPLLDSRLITLPPYSHLKNNNV